MDATTFGDLIEGLTLEKAKLLIDCYDAMIEEYEFLEEKAEKAYTDAMEIAEECSNELHDISRTLGKLKEYCTIVELAYDELKAKEA